MDGKSAIDVEIEKMRESYLRTTSSQTTSFLQGSIELEMDTHSLQFMCETIQFFDTTNGGHICDVLYSYAAIIDKQIENPGIESFGTALTLEHNMQEFMRLSQNLLRRLGVSSQSIQSKLTGDLKSNIDMVRKEIIIRVRRKYRDSWQIRACEYEIQESLQAWRNIVIPELAVCEPRDSITANTLFQRNQWCLDLHDLCKLDNTLEIEKQLNDKVKYHLLYIERQVTKQHEVHYIKQFFTNLARYDTNPTNENWWPAMKSGRIVQELLKQEDMRKGRAKAREMFNTHKTPPTTDLRKRLTMERFQLAGVQTVQYNIMETGKQYLCKYYHSICDKMCDQLVQHIESLRQIKSLELKKQNLRDHIMEELERWKQSFDRRSDEGLAQF